MATVYRLMGQEHFRGVVENEQGETTADNMSHSDENGHI